MKAKSIAAPTSIILDWLIVFLLVVVGCGRSEPPHAPDTAAVSKKSSIAVSSPYLEAALCDVLGRRVPLVRMAGPGMCPGHFDMRPSLIQELSRCELLVRFDFQRTLDQKLSREGDAAKTTLAVQMAGGLCVPENYLDACRQIVEHLVASGAVDRRKASERLTQIQRRMTALEREITRKIGAAGLRGAPVLCSGHQADFCCWLGLRVASEISSADAAGVLDVDQSLKAGLDAGARLIIANRPEGRRLADALADRMNARVVVFANFPDPNLDEAFDVMVRQNVESLLAEVGGSDGEKMGKKTSSHRSPSP